MPAPALPRLKYFEGMKMMNDMMNMDGTMDDMGMQMSNQMMDMNSVMYPEITGDDSKTDTMQMPARSADGDHSQHMKMSKKDSSTMKMDNMNSMEGMNMNTGSGIVTLSYDMLRSPVKTTLPGERKRVLHFSLTGNMNRYV